MSLKHDSGVIPCKGVRTMSKLILAEKPSVAQSIARVLDVSSRHDGYLEGNDYIVSWCVGHLVELAAPEAYDSKYSKWRCEDLPIFPEEWIYQVSTGTRKQFGVLKNLMERNDVTGLINCCDAGREGELIFRLVYHQCCCKKPFERLWISSMEDEAIREGFRSLRSGTEYDALYEAALCRERADWIVGMNATRFFSCLYGATLNVGRVMTPTLGMAVMREAEIQAFRQEPFYTVQLNFAGYKASSSRMKEKTAAVELQKQCAAEHKAHVISMERKEKSEKPPALYDLTSLQRDANRILGFTAQQTLDYTQNLYEKKLVTYPRTDSRYLTEDMAPALPEWLRKTADAFGYKNALPVHVEQVINSKKVSDHHAIIPTRSCADADFSGLPSGEKKVLMLIACRFLAAAGDPHRYAETEVKMTCGGQAFIAKGKETIALGWREAESHFYPPKNEKAAEGIPFMREGQELLIQKAEVREGKTSAPKRFTEDTLLSSMESAGAAEIPEGAERKGLGTPATRAGIIEKLVQKGFIERQGDRKTRYLVPTERGKSLISVMPEIIQSPTMTAEWEQRLIQIERGEYDPEAFMREITGMISSLIRNYEMVKGAEQLMNRRKVIGVCPHCGAEVTENQKGWFCANRECRFTLWKNNAFFTKIGKQLTGQLAEKLVRDGRAKMKDCRSEKTGKTYNATVLLTTEEDGRARFSLEFDAPRKKGGDPG